MVTVLGLDVTVTPSDALCKDASDGRVNVTINEDSSSYTFDLYQGSNLLSSVTKSNPEHVFTGLDIGNYSVRSTNADGCFDVTDFSISEPTLLEASVVKLYDASMCNGEVMAGSLSANPPQEERLLMNTALTTDRPSRQSRSLPRILKKYTRFS